MKEEGEGKERTWRRKIKMKRKTRKNEEQVKKI
jgi:hypothetical protein